MCYVFNILVNHAVQLYGCKVNFKYTIYLSICYIYTSVAHKRARNPTLANTTGGSETRVFILVALARANASHWLHARTPRE